MICAIHVVWFIPLLDASRRPTVRLSDGMACCHLPSARAGSGACCWVYLPRRHHGSWGGTSPGDGEGRARSVTFMVGDMTSRPLQGDCKSWGSHGRGGGKHFLQGGNMVGLRQQTIANQPEPAQGIPRQGRELRRVSTQVQGGPEGVGW